MISDLRDIAEDVLYEEIPRMPAAPFPARPGQVDRERQYREFWPAVRALLRTRYAGLDDQEELYQEAWTELLDYEAQSTSACVYSATLGTTDTTSTVPGRTIVRDNGGRVGVQTFDAGGSPADLPFHLVVTC